ncbi:blt [Symbiodinium sp. CCMP2456]|nr:blt [Symbiodinium sp. CCMP2456]
MHGENDAGFSSPASHLCAPGTSPAKGARPFHLPGTTGDVHLGQQSCLIVALVLLATRGHLRKLVRHAQGKRASARAKCLCHKPGSEITDKVVACKPGPQKVILVCIFLHLLGFTMGGPILPSLLHHFDLQAASTWKIVVAFPCGMFFAVLVFPYLSDQRGRRPVLMISYFGVGAFFVLQALAVYLENLPLFILMRFCSGSFAGASTVVKAYIADEADPKDLPKWMAHREAAATCAFVVGPLLGGYILELAPCGGLEAVLLLIGTSSFLAALLVFHWLRPRPSRPARQHHQESSSQSQRVADTASAEDSAPWVSIFTIIGVTCTYNFGQSFFDGFFPVLFSQRFSSDGRHLGLVQTSLAALVFVVTYFAYTPLVRRFRLVHVAVAGLFMIGLGVALLGVQLMPHVVAAGVLLYAVGVPLYAPSVPTMMARCAPSQKRGLVMGAESAVNSLARIASPVLLGHLYEASPEHAFLLVGMVVMVGALAMASKFGRSFLNADAAVALSGSSGEKLLRIRLLCEVRASGRGCITGNTILRNGAGGLLVESSRRAVTTIVRNRVWANSGCDLRQSPTSTGLLAGKAAAVTLANTVGHQDSPSASHGTELTAIWPQRVVTNSRDLRAAVREAPSDGFTFLQLQGKVVLEEPLLLDKPVILAGESLTGDSGSIESRGELHGPPGGSAVIVETAGSCALWRLNLILSPTTPASCVQVETGCPVLVDCDLQVHGVQLDGSVPTHCIRAAGAESKLLLIGCSLAGATGNGLLLVDGASASMVRCQVKSNRQGGVFLADSASLLAESSDISRNGHFGVVAGSRSGSLLVGRTDLTGNDAGSLWQTGGDASSSLAFLDQCSVSGSTLPAGNMASPAIVLGALAKLVLWDCFAPTMRNGTLAAALRAEAGSRATVAGDGPTLGWSGWMPRSRTTATVDSGPAVGAGSVAWLDVSGAPVLQTKPSTAAKSRPSSASTTPSRSAGSKEQPRPRSSSAQSQSSDLAADGTPGAKPKKKKKDKSKGTSGDKEEKEHKDAEAKTESAAGGESGRSEEPTPPWSAEEADTSTVVDEVSEAPDRSGQAAEEGGHDAWLRTRMERSAGFGTEEGDRWTLFEILEMLATKDNHKEEVLDSVGLSGQIKPQDTVYLRGHTGRWMAVKDGTQVLCNAADRAQAAAFVIEFKGPALKNDCRVGFKLDSTDGRLLWLGVLPSGDVGLMQKGDGGSDTSMRFVAKTSSPAAVLSGTSVHFKSMATGKMMEVDGADVRARSNTEGTRQRIAVEKLAVDISLPEPSPDLDLTVEQKAWAYLQAAHCALVDRQNLARFLSSPKPHCKELLKAYTKLWESEWRVEWRQTLEIPEESAASSPGSRQSSRSNSAGPAAASDSSRPRARSQSIRRRMSRTDWILGMVGGVSSTADDKSNGNLFVSAMRSFFANAIKMSQLEADPVQRVIEAFAEALVADAAFLSCFEASMLPEKERQTYRKPDEVLFGLAYTTLMLNTDMHNKQVASKMWDSKKFVGAGKGCGVTGGLMAQIYKNVQSEEI